jgi:hypothetical protein
MYAGCFAVSYINNVNDHFWSSAGDQIWIMDIDKDKKINIIGL